MAAEAIFEAAKLCVVKADKDKVSELLNQAQGEGVAPMDVLNKGFIPGIGEVGDQFGRGILFLPELILAAEVMQAATDQVNQRMGLSETQEKKGRVLIATVEGDVHDIGKAIVVSLFRANGFEVSDMGRDVPVDKIIDAAVAFNADFIGTSALLTTTMTQQKLLEQKLKNSGLKDRFKTMVGGAPCTQRWANRIGADAYAEDASDGVKKVAEMLAAV
jgi:trimethylamine corrinoid protein